jgi:hypothetical protein
MSSIIEAYQDVARDNVNDTENGYLAYERFNRMSRRAERRLIDWLSGDVAGVQPPEPYLSQKNKDWLAPFIEKFSFQVVNGVIQRPSNYYGFENMYRLGNKISSECEEDEAAPDGSNTVIELLDGSKFTERCNTYVDELKPSFKKPISKAVGRKFEFMPMDLGSGVLEYYRYPKYGEIKWKNDPIYNDVIADPDTSIDYEWDDSVMELLIWFITDTFANTTREQTLKKMNQETGKSPRG